MFDGHYGGWVDSRMNCIQAYIRPDALEGKTLLELGAGYGYVGSRFSNLGAHVTASDARSEYIEHMKNTNPHIPTLLIDGDNDTLTDTYDIIVHWGLLYHLKEIDSHLEMISKHCSILFLETEVADSDDQHFFIQTDESGYDQAFNSKGIRPSAPYVERILSRNGFQFKRIEDPILNWDFHMYDWPLKNTGTWNHGLRRFWICWKDTVPSPLLPGRE